MKDLNRCEAIVQDMIEDRNRVNLMNAIQILEITRTDQVA